jgi:glycosyltransferase involved in cell wall biosynthesis
MKKGLYLHFEEIGDSRKSGIRNKIDGQCDAFTSAGYSIDQVYFKTKKELWFNELMLLRIPSRQLFFRYFVFRKILGIVNSNKYRFIYIRYTSSDSHLLNFLKKVKLSGVKVFIEFPTFPYDGEVTASNLIENLAIKNDKSYRGRLHRYADYAISTVDLDEMIFNIPTFRMSNGVNTSVLKMANHKPVRNQVRLIGVANISRWHAWDRVIEGLREYYRKEHNGTIVSFRVVGSGNGLELLKSLTEKYDLGEYIQFAGPRTGPELDQEFESADVAIGSLGLHRLGLTHTSVLKLGEYTARGFPSVIAYNDPALKGAMPFICEFPADESPIDIGKLIRFYSDLKIKREDIRQFAEDHLSWSTTMKPLLEKI